MGEHNEVFVALDVAKLKNAVALAEGGRNGEVRYLGEIENTLERFPPDVVHFPYPAWRK